MTTCARCDHELGIGRFCLNCGHPAGEPVPPGESRFEVREDTPLPEQTASRTPSLLTSTLAIGAVLLVILFAVLVSCLGGDDDEPGIEDAAISDVLIAGNPAV